MVLDALQSQEQTDMVVAADIQKLVEEEEMTGRVLGSALDSAAEQILSLVEDPSFGEGGICCTSFFCQK